MFEFDQTQSLSLSGERTFLIKQCSVRFERWSQPHPEWWHSLSKPYKRKPLLKIEDRALFAELVILDLLKRDGWNGFWRDNWGKCFRSKLPLDKCELPSGEAAQGMFDSIVSANGGRPSGCFDVFAWRGDQFSFLEAKGPGDGVKESQLRWVAAAQKAGVSVETFGIVEWNFAV